MVALTVYSGETPCAMGRKKPGWKPYDAPLKPFEGNPRRIWPPRPTPEELSRLDTEQALIKCAQEGQGEEALRLLGELEAYGRPSRENWNTAVEACAKQGLQSEAIELLERMDKVRIPPDHVAYHSAIEACRSSNEGLRLLREMRDRGLPPNMFSYKAAITLLAEKGQKEEATSLWREAEAQGLFPVWKNAGRNLDVTEYPIPMAEIIVRCAVEDRATWLAKSKAGKGDFWVLTGSATKPTSQKQQAVVRVMREEYGLKVRVEPALFGRCRVRGDELKRLGQEWALEKPVMA